MRKCSPREGKNATPAGLPARITQLPPSTGRLPGLKLSGKWHDEGCQHSVPIVEAAIARHRIGPILSDFAIFPGWDAPALWDKTKISMRHGADAAGQSLPAFLPRQNRILRSRGLPSRLGRTLGRKRAPCPKKRTGF
jgi:hypothetical protein